MDEKMPEHVNVLKFEAKPKDIWHEFRAILIRLESLRSLHSKLDCNDFKLIDKAAFAQEVRKEAHNLINWSDDLEARK